MVRFTEDLLSQVVEAFCLKQKAPLKKLLFYIEKTLLFKALRKCNRNQREAARLLGMKYTTLHEKVKKYGIQFEKKPLVD
jgi:transcriptional regulator with GAF, ATPase, and Fis domain